MVTQKDILANEDFYAKSLKIGITVDDIMSEFNAFDWLDLVGTPETEVIKDFAERLNFKPRKKFISIETKAFAYKMERAIINLAAIAEEVSEAYNYDKKGGLGNEHLDKYYYIKYWADKKLIPVDYNSKKIEDRSRFNLYTILMDIYALKLENYNAFHNSNNRT